MLFDELRATRLVHKGYAREHFCDVVDVGLSPIALGKR
jgi:hypothetical protein